MKVLLFGATGGTGLLVAQRALDVGYSVTAFIRNPSKLTISHANLNVVQGSVLDQAQIESAMPEHEAIICCLGRPALQAGFLRSQGTLNIISAMKNCKIKRLICLTSLGYGDSKIILRNTPFVFRRIIAPLLLRSTFHDHSTQESYVAMSDLNWTIVRPGTLTNEEASRIYRTGFDYKDPTVKVKISRKDLAEYLIHIISERDTFNKTIGISY
jgi:putative NADH-flavin reductase